MTEKITIRDVAERAGCGVATVSRVLNGSGPASPETRQRVYAAAEALGLEFSEIGRSLQRQRTRTIGCLIPSLVNPVFADAVQALQSEVQAAGYHLLLMCSEYDPELETEAIRMLIQKQVEGLVLTVSDAERSEGLAMVRDRGLRHCLIFNAPAQGEAAFYVDNTAAACRVAEAFACAGHRHSGFLALRFKSSDRSRQRFEGFREACLERGMAEPVLLEIDEDQADLSDQLDRLLTAHGALTGIFASNDFLALALIRSARELGRQIPQDLSVVGFDGIAIGNMVDPVLATIVTDARAMGRGAARALLQSIETNSPPSAAAALGFEFRHGASLGRARTASTRPEDRDDGTAATAPSPLHHPSKTIHASQEQ